MFPGMASSPSPMSMKPSETDSQKCSVEEMRDVVRHARRALAFKMWDFFDSIDKLDEKEFMDIISELDGDGIKISQMIEKFRKYKSV